MKFVKTLGVGVVMALAIPALASAVTFIGSFHGHATHSGSPGVYTPGDTYTARLILDTQQEDPWYPWDAGKEYTAVMTVDVDTYNVFANAGGPGIDLVIVDFETGAVSIYEDTTTPADYANPATFTDGTEILVGQVDNMIAERLTIFGLPFGVTGVVVFTAGDGLGNLLGCAPGGLSMNDFIDVDIITNPDGYLEAYDAEWKCEQTVSVEPSTWGNIKGLYR